MTKIIMHGCNGRMGHVIADLAAEDQNIRIVAGVDAHGESSYSFPVYPTLQACQTVGDVIIDFSHQQALYY